MKTKKRKQFSMKYKMMIICLCSTLLTVMAISITTMPRIISELKTSTEDHMNNFVVDHSEKIMSGVSDTFSQIKDISTTADRVMDAYREAMASKDEESYAKLKNYQDVFIEDLKHFSEDSKEHDHETKIYAITASGLIIAASDGTNPGEQVAEEIYSGAECEEGKISVVSSYDEETKHVNITYVSPTYEDGSLAGYIVYIQSSLEIDELVDDYTLIGIDSPRISLNDKDGMVIAHSDNERIGTSTTNETLLGDLEAIRNGSYTKEGPQSANFTSGGKDFTLSYIYLPETDWVLSMSVADDILYSKADSIVKFYILIIIVVVILMMIAVMLIVTRFTKSIIQMSHIIHQIAELDFTIDVEDKQFRAICDRNDEIGEMGNSIDEMIGVVKERLQKVLQSSDEVNNAALRLKDITTNISEKATDTSATTEELSAGMEETGASANVILADVDSIQENVASIKEQISTNTNVTLEIMTRADQRKQESIRSEQNTRATFEEIKRKGADAIEQSKATAQINELAQVIMEIADQTSLLALNASIEAARAGESGRGFAVVADEIGNLAQQSSDTVNKISHIVQTVNEAVANITECLSESQKFVENNVYRDYASQLATLEAYNQDADNINGAMNQIDANTQTLYTTMQRMADSIRGITQTIQEAAIGVTDIAEKNSEIGNLTSESYQMVNDTNRITEELEASISAFKL